MALRQRTRGEAERERGGGSRGMLMRYCCFRSQGRGAERLLQLRDALFQPENSGDQLRRFGVHLAVQRPNFGHGHNGEQRHANHKRKREETRRALVASIVERGAASSASTS